MLDHGFLMLDTSFYFPRHPWMQDGLSWESVRLAFTTPVHGYWQPVTVLSHVLDCELYGLAPWGHHLTSVLVHAGNVMLLFGVCAAATGRLGASALVAALFAVHPTRVEAVAWVAQRRDLLSALFGLLAVAAHVHFAQSRSRAAYAAATGCLLLSLMAKPMLITLPVLLLLLDVWPLGRLGGARGREGRRALAHLAAEKLPMLAVALPFVVTTVLFQSGAGAVVPLASLPLELRIWKSAIAVFLYLRLVFWPDALSILYPLDLSALSPAKGLAAVGAIAALTAAAWRARRRAPQLLFGWLFLLVSLAPVIGIVQVGVQAVADRFTYVPAIGAFVAVAFSLDAWALRGVARRCAAIVLGLAVVATCAAATREYAAVWRDPEELYRHALASVGESAHLRDWLGKELIRAGRYEAAIVELDRSIELQPQHSKYYARARAREALGETAPALDDYLRGLALARTDGDHLRGQRPAARLALALGRFETAEGLARGALAIDPESREATVVLADALLRTGRGAEALAQLDALAARRPDDVILRVRTAWVRATHPASDVADPERALATARVACDQTGRRNARALDALAAAHAARGDFDRAVAVVDEAHDALARAPHPERFAGYAAELARRRALYVARRPFVEDPAQGSAQ